MLRPLIYPFLAYRSFILPILALVLIVVPCWCAVRAYRRRTRGKPPSLQRELLLLAFVLYLAGLAAVTLAPTQGSRLYDEGAAGIELRPSLGALTCSSALPGGGPAVPAFCERNAWGNVLLFFPLGLLVPLVWRRIGFWRGMPIAIAVSASIELIQHLSRAWGSYRSPDVNDVILNALGACLGLGVVALLRLRPGGGPAVPRP